MPIQTALVISAIISVFFVFAIVLAWADYQTRGLVRETYKRRAENVKNPSSFKLIHGDKKDVVFANDGRITKLPQS